METINSLSTGHKSQTCFTLITFQPPSFGAASNCVLRYPFPLSVKFASTFCRANQRSGAKFESPLQPRTDETYKVETWAGLFFPTSQVSLVFPLASRSLATSWLARSTTLNPKKGHVPWTEIQRDRDSYIKLKYLPEGVALKQYYHLCQEDIDSILEHWV